MSAVMRRQPLDLRTAEGMLTYVDGCEDRATWVAIGMALKTEFGDPAFEAWDRWSSNAANYDTKACRSSWRGFKARNGGYTVGTLIKLAKDGGYKFDESDAPVVDNAEIARRRSEQAARRAADQQKKEQSAAQAEQQAHSVWRAADRSGSSTYAQRKGIDAPESCRFIAEADGGGLLIPMLRYDLDRAQALKGLQIIRDADGSKRFTPGMAKSGCACRLGLAAVGDPVFVVEGYATGMTVRMALQRRFAVFVAFDAYNLPTVVESVHKAMPDSPIVICADDDYRTLVRGLPNNVGRIQSQIALDGVMDAGARLAVRTFPVFKKETARGDKDTDFNDLHRLEGLAEVTQQMELCLDAIQTLKTYG